MKKTEALLFKISKSNDLSESEYEEILELCARAFEQDYKLFMDIFHNATHVQGFYQDLLVTHAAWVTRWLKFGDSPLLKTAYVEAVATDKNYQRRGLATSIMKKLAHEIRDYDLGALSPGTPELYAELGWQMWRGPLYIRTHDGLVHTTSDSVMILKLNKTLGLNLDAPLSAEWRKGKLW